jgi:hypothetical protein
MSGAGFAARFAYGTGIKHGTTGFLPALPAALSKFLFCLIIRRGEWGLHGLACLDLRVSLLGWDGTGAITEKCNQALHVHSVG